jgi:hypothetical protein
LRSSSRSSSMFDNLSGRPVGMGQASVHLVAVTFVIAAGGTAVAALPVRSMIETITSPGTPSSGGPFLMKS